MIPCDLVTAIKILKPLPSNSYSIYSGSDQPGTQPDYWIVKKRKRRRLHETTMIENRHHDNNRGTD